METTKALWQSSHQLRAIGRNLNQIAKQLNEGKSSASSLSN
ncbi:plasmid mobilization relaxosome protein MobC [Advenella sp. EE-W14]